MTRGKLPERLAAAGFTWARTRLGDRCAHCEGGFGFGTPPALRIPRKCRTNPGGLLHLCCVGDWQATNKQREETAWTRQHLRELEDRLKWKRELRANADKPGHDFAAEPPTHYHKANLDNEIHALEDRVARAQRVLKAQEEKQHGFPESRG